MNEHAPAESSLVRSAKSKVSAFIVLCFILSCPFWFLIASAAKDPRGGKKVLLYTLALMWCSGIAAILVRLIFQRNLRGFGFNGCRAGWFILALFIPVIFGLVMFGSAWASGIAPLNAVNLKKTFSISFLPFFAIGLLVNCVGALGEELGWRGLLVPELSRGMQFSRVALISSAVWTVWHFPLILFGPYLGSGPWYYSMAAFVVLVMISGVIQAYFRLAAGSIWPSVILHGAWNYFIQMFYPLLTAKTQAGEKMLGEFGWFTPSLLAVLFLIVWMKSVAFRSNRKK